MLKFRKQWWWRRRRWWRRWWHLLSIAAVLRHDYDLVVVIVHIVLKVVIRCFTRRIPGLLATVREGRS
jgi:hypothetical protein